MPTCARRRLPDSRRGRGLRLIHNVSSPNVVGRVSNAVIVLLAEMLSDTVPNVQLLSSDKEFPIRFMGNPIQYR